MKNDNKKPPFVIRDVQEKSGIWQFNKSESFAGTIEKSLKTGDYTLEFYEHIFAIERKASTGEIAGNLPTKQFLNEMKRGDQLRHFFVICEFSLPQILQFPYQSGIPKRIWPKLKVTSKYLLKKIIELETNHNVKFLFCNDPEAAKEAARAIFKRMIEMYGDEINEQEPSK